MGAPSRVLKIDNEESSHPRKHLFCFVWLRVAPNGPKNAFPHESQKIRATTLNFAKTIAGISLVLWAISLCSVHSQQSTRQVEDLARQFARRLRETREFKPDVEKLFTESFTDCHLREGLAGRENAIFAQISAPIPADVAKHAGKNELQRYLIARLNHFHLTILQQMSTRDLKDGWPNSSDNKTVKNIDELRTVLRTLEQENVALRELFKTHPPEETETYKKNLAVIGKDGNDSKFWKVSFHELTDQQIDDGRACLGFRPQAMATVTIPPFYNLIVFQTGNEFKIGSLFCTEPPCVD